MRRPEIISKMKAGRVGHEYEYHQILLSLVRLGVSYDAVKRIDSTFQSQLSASQLDELKVYSHQV